MSDEKKVLVERALHEKDGFGFTIEWKYNGYWTDVKAYEVTALDGDSNKINYQRFGAQSSGDLVYNIEDAEVYLEGYIKWDGCSELGSPDGGWHWCGPFCYKKHIALLEFLYHRAMQLMERKDEW